MVRSRRGRFGWNAAADDILVLLSVDAQESTYGVEEVEVVTNFCSVVGKVRSDLETVDGSL